VNEHEVEELVVRLTRPAPSPELDARIGAILGRSQPLRATRPARAILLLSSTAACAGLVGFVMGRASVLAPVPISAPASVPELGPTAIDHPITAPANVATAESTSSRRNIQTEVKRESVEVSQNEAFVRFVMQPKKTMSLFADRPLKVEQSSSSVP
jgi:hypothetical protein